jgi:hypothetical protein
MEMYIPDNLTFEHGFISVDSFGNEPNYFLDSIFPDNISKNLPFLSELEKKETIQICIDNKDEDRDKDETKTTKKTNLGRKKKEISAQNLENEKCHDRFGKDNLKSKIQNHYISFIIDYVNYILLFLGYRKQFYKISYKDKIKMNFSSLKDKNLGEILQKDVSPSFDKVNCDENIKTFDEIKDEPGVKDLFSENYLDLFKNIYYKNKRYLNLSNYGKDINIYLPNKKIKMFEDLLEKENKKDGNINKIRENKSNKDYKEELIKAVENNYLKNLRI